MSETMQPMPEEVSEEKFQEAQDTMENKGVMPESPSHNEELQRLWKEDKQRREKGYAELPETWQTKEQDR